MSTAAPDTERRAKASATLLERALLRGGPARTVHRGVRIPMRDGIDLLADHYAPDGEAKGTVLVRSPYPPVVGLLSAGTYITAGYHVVLVRCRGTSGSGGTFRPMEHEVDDGADTVAWLREQPWFGGRFATVGASYLGFTQWALLMDPPPELATAIIQVGPHDLSRSVYAGGAFSLNDFLGWSDQVAHQEQFGLPRTLLRMATATRRQAPAMAALPLAQGGTDLTGDNAPWYPDWIGHRDLTDPFWAPMQLGAALDRVQVPVLLLGGWQDLFLRQTLEQYEHLHRRGLDVAMTIGPWTHTSANGADRRMLAREGLDWLAEHLTGAGSRLRWSPVRVFVTGLGEWRELPEWPPPSTERVLHPGPGGVLGDEPAPDGAAPVGFTYDPADPTPTIGGRLLATGTSGYREDTALGRRADVLTFDTPPLTAPLEVVGVPVVELAHTSDNPHADLFVRISEVDPKGRSHNVSDGFVRLDAEGADPDGAEPDSTGSTVRLELDAIAHRFTRGNRIRLLVAGGSFPRFERNLGTGGDPATSAALAPSRRTIRLAGSRMVLPVRT